MKNIKKNHAQWALANICASIAATASFWGSLALFVGGVMVVVTFVIPIFSHEIATNTSKAALYFSFAVFAVFAVFAFLIWWCGSIISGIVFDFVRRLFGFPERIFSGFSDKGYRHEVLFHLPLLWSCISLVALICYAEFRIEFDPEIAHRSAIIAERFEQKTLPRNFAPPLQQHN